MPDAIFAHPRGYLVFETRRPERRAWEEWAADTGPVTLDLPGHGPVEQRREVTAVNLPLVSFRHTYTFLADGAVITSDFTLRFRGRDELESSLAARATGCWTCGTLRTARAASSCSSPSAPPDRTRPEVTHSSPIPLNKKSTIRAKDNFAEPI